MPAEQGRRGASLRWWERRPSTSDLRVYVVAVSLVAASLLFRWILRAWFGGSVPYLQFFPAILIAAWYGGLGPGMLATALSAVAAMYLLLPPPGLAVGGTPDMVSLAFFVAIGLGISWLNHQLRTSALLSASRAERLDAIINTTVDGIIVIDLDGKIEAFNRGARAPVRLSRIGGRRTKRQRADAVPVSRGARRLSEALSDDRRRERIIGKGREVTGRRRDGTVFPLHLSVGEMTIGGQRKFTGMLHDLTERVRLKGELGSSEARWQAVIDSAVDGIIVIDAHGRIEAFNPAAERLFGYSAAGGARSQRGHADAVPVSRGARHVSGTLSRNRSSQDHRHRTRSAGASEGRHDVSAPSVRRSDHDGRRTEVHRNPPRSQRPGPDGGAAARAGRAGQARAKWPRSSRTRSRIRWPVSAGRSRCFGSQMSDGGTKGQVLNEIVSRIDALDQMMKDLLLFARPPKPRRAPTDLVSLVTTTANLLSQDPALKDLDVEVEGSAPTLSADPDMLRIVFQNLLINGAHAMKGKGRIRVAVDAIDSTCQIAFIDSGPGIPTEIRDKIFTPFFTTKSRGSGLGLPTAKRLIEAHNGQIAIDCPPAGGTTVVVRLPIGAA